MAITRLEALSEIRGVRVDPRVKLVLGAAQGLARRTDQVVTNTAHILASTAQDPETAQLLGGIGLDAGRLVLATESYFRIGSERPRGGLRIRRLTEREPDSDIAGAMRSGVRITFFSDLANLAIDKGADEVNMLNEKLLLPKHLVLAMSRENNTYAAQVLATMGINIDRFRGHVVSSLTGVLDLSFQSTREQQPGVRLQDEFDKLRDIMSDDRVDPGMKVQARLMISEMIRRMDPDSPRPRT